MAVRKYEQKVRVEFAGRTVTLFSYPDKQLRVAVKDEQLTVRHLPANGDDTNLMLGPS